VGKEQGMFRDRIEGIFFTDRDLYPVDIRIRIRKAQGNDLPADVTLVHEGDD
jgi:hypothetical protein